MPTFSALRLLALACLVAIIGCLGSGCAARPVGSGSSAQIDEDITRALLSADVAEQRFRADPSDLIASIWHARHLGYAGEHLKAINVLTEALEHHPDEPRLLRHRGHRLISARRYSAATADLALAARVIEGTEDEIEPDGRPNDAGIPRSTLHTNVHYHLGLARYLQSDFLGAAQSFARCVTIAENDDMRVAAAYWLVLSMVHLDRMEEAMRLARIYSDPELEVLENHAYQRLHGLFVGRVQYDTIMANLSESDWTGAATELYGVGMWHLMNGRTTEAIDVFRAITSGPVSSAFGRLAAEIEAGRAAPTLE